MIRRVYHPVKCNPRDPGVSEGEVVVVMWSVSFRVKWWWMLRTRRGLASWGMDTYPPGARYHRGVGDPVGPVTEVAAMVGRMEAASVIPTGGGAVIIIVISIFVGVICGITAAEMRRNMFGWTIIGVAGSLLVISAVRAVLWSV